MKQYQFQLIRYMHDHFTGEYVNVGVVVYSKEEQFLACKITKKYQRITHMFPEANGKWVMSVLHHVANEIARVSGDMHRKSSDSLESITHAILVRDNNALRLTEVQAGIDIDLQAALDNLFYAQVEKHVAGKNEKHTMLDNDVWKTKYKEYFEKYGVSKRLKKHTVSIPQDVILFDKSWKNDVWHCYEPLSFALKEKDAIKDKVYKWAGKIQGLVESKTALHLTLLTSIASEHQELMPFIQKYLQVAMNNVTVEIVTDENAEHLAQEIRRQMDIHDDDTLLLDQ
jgi:hypothetical protein